MENFTNVIKDNFEELKNSIEKIKNNYPNIDSDPNSHDGSYELIRAIIMQYKEEIDNSSNWGADDVNALYYATTFVKRDTKIEKISKSNLKNKEKLKQLIQNLNKKFQNKEYTNNIDEANDIGMFKNVSGGFGDKTNAKASEEDLRNFIIFCTEIIDENDNNTIYTMFEKNICNKISDNSMSIGILSQILHCLKPNIFPILNGGGLDFYQKALNIKMKSNKGKEVQIDSTLKNYIKVINAIKDNTKDLKFNNYRILDIIAQKYYFSFDDINKYFTVLAGSPSKNRPANEVGKCRAGHDNFKLISKKINKNDFEYEIHQWNNGKTANPYFWAEYKNKEFKDLPYSISFFAEGKNIQFRIDIECKGEDAIFSEWIPDKIIGFDDFGNNTSKLVKIFNGPFEYANSRNTIEQIQKAFSKLEPEYNKLCNIALGKVVPVTESAGESSEGEIMHNFPLNQILYGPPGTGKTYNTVVKAMSILDDKEYVYDQKNDNYVNNKDNSTVKYKKLLERFQEEINKKYDDNSKRIEFVTFHQSYSYEEFVEGIKPDLENSDLKYIREDGVFKRICDNAGTKVTNDFEKIYAKFIEEFDDNFEFKTSKSSFKVRINEKDGLTIRTGDNFDVEKSGTITKEQIKNQTYTSEGRRIKLETITKYLQDIYGLQFDQDKQNQPYVLIIDEINRGDVSKIFGELITLIEPDKRIGSKYAMKVTLPYSKEPFGIPDNLYIIGTMNTADRSIALLDTALRRRFDFEEMPPEPRLIKDERIEGTEINPRNLLINLNNRIEKYFDKDHKIGHSYLMDIESKDQLEKAYKNKILPLLNEYFYNDSETVGKVLNCKEYENKDYLEVLKETQKEYKKGADDQE